MSMFNAIDLTGQGKRGEVYFKFRRSQDVREEIPARTLDVSLPWETKRNGMETAATNLKENGSLSLQRWYSDPRKQVTGS